MKRLALLAALLLLLAGCDSAAPDVNDLALGTFKAEVTGAVTTSFEGRALFGSSRVENSVGFALSLTSSNFSRSILLYRMQGRPGTGTYQIVDGQLGFLGQAAAEDFWGLGSTGSEEGAFSTKTGTLTISFSSRERLEGTFEFDGMDTQERTITLTGSFRAQCTSPVEGGCE